MSSYSEVNALSILLLPRNTSFDLLAKCTPLNCNVIIIYYNPTQSYHAWGI